MDKTERDNLLETISELNEAHDAQNEVLRKKQAEIRSLQAELDAACDALRKTQIELASAKLGIQ